MTNEMRVPRNTPSCTVRSTVLAILVVASTFIFLDSFRSQLLSISWSQPSSSLTQFNSENPSKVLHSIAPNAPAGSKADETPASFTKSDDGSRQHSAEKDTPAGPQGGDAGRKAGAGELDHDQDFSTVQNLTSAVDFEKDDVHHETEIKESGSGIGAVLPIKDVTGSMDNVVGPEKVDAAEQSGERHEVLSRSENPGTPSEIISTSPKAAETIRKVPARRYDDLSSIQKVEFDLWQARSAMRKVVLAQMNSSTNAAADDHQSVPEGEPWGDVYRNAAILRQSYQEMERRFRVYTYEEGEEPLVHNGPCKEIYAVEGRFIQELQRDNPYVTDDPETAHVFFLPFSVAMMVTYLYTANSGDMSPLLRFAKDYVNVVAQKYPYWTRSGGADHFMLSCHDWGPHVSRADANLVSKTIRVLCNANISEGYIPSKDASLPEIHLVGGEIPAELGGLPASRRTLLAFFAGGDHGPVRPELFKHWEGKDEEIRVYHEVPAEGLSYHTYMKSSKYCLCPGGYEVNSPRIVEAIYNDCVAVVIADNFVLPFSDVLDWKTFAVHVLEKDIPNLKTILQAIPMETYIQMQARVKQVRHHFLLNQPPQRYDVFHMILHSVWLRRLNIRLLG